MEKDLGERWIPNGWGMSKSTRRRIWGEADPKRMGEEALEIVIKNETIIIA